jgi:hypothetical protein
VSAYLTEVLHYQNAVRDGTVLSGEWDSGPVQVRRTEGHVGRAVVVNQLDCDLKKQKNLLETDNFLKGSKVYASVNIHNISLLKMFPYLLHGFYSDAVLGYMSLKTVKNTHRKSE